MEEIDNINMIDQSTVASLGLVDTFGNTKVVLQQNNTRGELTTSLKNLARVNAIVQNINYQRLRPQQKKGVRNIMSMLYHDIHEGLAKMPTGTGKTTYFSEILCALGEPSLVQVPRRLLIPQTMRELVDSGYEADQIFSLPPYVYNEKEDKFVKVEGNKSAAQNLEKILDTIEKKQIKNPVIVATYASLKSIFKDNAHLLDKLKALISNLVSDEAHHTTGNVATDMIEYFMDKNSDVKTDKLHIKLTATPDRKNVSLRETNHMIIDIRLQECVDDGTLILPKFRGVGNAYLPYNKGEKAPTDTEIQNSGKYIDETGRPIREVLIDAYIEDKKKYPYLPGVVFCGTIEEAKQTAAYCNSLGLRAEPVTSDDDKTIEDIEDMIYNDEKDLIVTVYKVAEGFDLRPLRVALRLNASRDPVYKTQGNGRIYRIMKEKDVERIFAALRPKDVYKNFDDESLREMIRKTHENTFLYEPDKWLVAADYKPMESGRERGEGRGGGGTVQGKPMTIIEELPNSVEELVLCGEMDYEYIMESFPNVSINIKEVVEAFAKSGITSMQSFLCSNEDEVLRLSSKLSQTNHQKVRNIYAMRSLKELNKMAVLLGFAPMKQEEFDVLFEKEYTQFFGSKSIKELYNKYRPKGSFNRFSERKIFGYPLWKYKYGKSLDTLSFEQIFNLLGKDIREEIKMCFTNTTMASLLNDQMTIFKEWMDIVNIARKQDDLSLFRSNSSAARVGECMTYLGNILGLPSVKSELVAVLEKNGITTPRQLMDANWGRLVTFLKDFDTPTIRSYIGIYSYGALSENPDAKKALIAFIWGADVVDGMIYEIVAKQYLPDIADGLEGVAKLSQVNAKEIGDLLGLKKIDMNTAFYQQIIAAALEGKIGKEVVAEQVKTARNMSPGALQKKIAGNKLLRNHDIKDAKELAQRYQKDKDLIDKDVKESFGGYAINVGDIIKEVYETTPQQTVKDELIALGKYKASVIFEEFDTIYPLIKDILSSVYTNVQPGNEDSIKGFISWLKLDLTTEAEENRKHIIDTMDLDDLTDMDLFWQRADVAKTVRYLYDQEAFDTGSYKKAFFQKVEMYYINNKKNKYLQSFGKTPIHIMLNYEKIEKKNALRNLHHILKPSHKEQEALSLEMLESLIPSTLSNSDLKDYLQQQGYDTIEKKKNFCSEKMKNTIWSYIFRKIVRAKQEDTEDQILKAVMLSIAPSPREILLNAFEKQNIRTKKDFDAFWKTYTAMKATDTQKSQWTMRFGKFFFGPNFKDTGYTFNEDEYKRLKTELVNKSLLVS